MSNGCFSYKVRFLKPGPVGPSEMCLNSLHFFFVLLLILPEHTCSLSKLQSQLEEKMTFIHSNAIFFFFFFLVENVIFMFTTLNRGTLLLLFNMINKEYTMDHLLIFKVCVCVYIYNRLY